MRLLLLIPNFVLMLISGYNLLENASWKNDSNYLIFTLLHVFVLAICITFAALIIKSFFRITYVEVDETLVETTEFETIHV